MKLSEAGVASQQHYKFDVQTKVISVKAEIRQRVLEADAGPQWEVTARINLPFRRDTEYHAICRRDPLAPAERAAAFDYAEEQDESHSRAIRWRLKERELICERQGIVKSFAIHRHGVLHVSQFFAAFAGTFTTDIKHYAADFVAGREMLTVDLIVTAVDETFATLDVYAHKWAADRQPPSGHAHLKKPPYFSFIWNHSDKLFHEANVEVPMLGKLQIRPTAMAGVLASDGSVPGSNS
jgi:hypothetical protein